MKRYLVFAGDTYYPRGGWQDLFGYFDTEVEALRTLLAASPRVDWYHIIDTETWHMLPPSK